MVARGTPPTKAKPARTTLASAMATAHMLAVSLEKLTKEANGFRSKLGTLTDENTKLRRALEAASTAADTDRAKCRKLEAQCKDADRVVSALKSQAGGFAKYKADAARKHEAKVGSLMKQLNELKEERYARAQVS
eukprot:COSAG05_NODE_1190_length_5573_cov_33.432590_2_plen_135_part_00